ncbi:hypothetical protein ACFUCV_08210 [Specibacter sp. NPDC057265]
MLEVLDFAGAGALLPAGEAAASELPVAVGAAGTELEELLESVR